MGYSTDFEGELKFTSELAAPALAKLNSMLGEDCREHPEWDAGSITHIDLELTKDFSGIKWNGAEKTYGMVDCVNFLIRRMREDYRTFGLTGSLLAQGEDASDRWQLSIGQDGFAYAHELKLAGATVKCPHCGEEFQTPEIKA